MLCKDVCAYCLNRRGFKWDVMAEELWNERGVVVCGLHRTGRFGQLDSTEYSILKSPHRDCLYPAEHSVMLPSIPELPC